MYVNAETISVETVPGIWEGRIKESGGRSEFKNDVFDAVYEPL
jgi:hypothetical protein